MQKIKFQLFITFIYSTLSSSFHKNVIFIGSELSNNGSEISLPQNKGASPL